MDVERTAVAWAPRMMAVLRIMTGLLFLEHGTQKLLNLPMRVNNGPMPPLIFGVFTRPVAFLLAGNMAVAYFMAHAPRGFYPITMGGNGGELSILFCFMFLYFMAAGAGPWSVDDARRGRV